MKLSKEEASHLYELSLENFQEGCPECDLLKEKLEKYIGSKEVKTLKKLVKDNPYRNV